MVREEMLICLLYSPTAAMSIVAVRFQVSITPAQSVRRKTEPAKLSQFSCHLVDWQSASSAALIGNDALLLLTYKDKRISLH